MAAADAPVVELGAWPELAYDEMAETVHLLHMCAQIVGKIRVARTPLVNHWWNTTLQVYPRGLRSGVVPDGAGAFEVALDLVAHEVLVETSGAGRAAIPLRPMSVADLYRELRRALADLAIDMPRISEMPNELATAIPFPKDTAVRAYDGDHAARFADALLRTYHVFERFRAGFIGKASPVQFFWGSFDLASARFSGRRGGDYRGGVPPHVHPHVMHEAYSHELIAAGFWLGSDDVRHAEYYSYAMPAPMGLADAAVRPAAASWPPDRGEFVLAYADVRAAPDPEAALLAFLQSTYDAAADLGKWDRELLEEGVRCDCEPVPSAMRRPPRSLA